MRILIICVVFAILSFGAETSNKPYDYIDNNTTIDKNVAEYNSALKKEAKKYVESKNQKKYGDKEPSGWIIGAGGTIAYTLNIREQDSSVNAGTDYGFDVLAGYKWFFTRGFGMRLYIDYNMRFLEILKSHNIALNYDLLFNWAKSKPLKFGMILGLHIGGNVSNYDKYCYADCKQGAMILGGNIGFRFVIYDNSAIEILAQPRIAFKPVEYYSVAYDTNSYYEKSNNSLSFGEFAIIGNLRFVYTF